MAGFFFCWPLPREGDARGLAKTGQARHCRVIMKTKVVVVVLALVAAALAVSLLVTRQRARAEQQKATETILYHSNRWVTVEGSLETERRRRGELERQLADQQQALTQLTNEFALLSARLKQTEGALTETRTQLENTRQTLAQREARIAELESQRNELDQRAQELTMALTNLTQQIEEVRRRLAAAEGDKAFLEQELKRLLAEKAELERQLNDLETLRAQVAKLREELNLARRLEWIRRGLLGGPEVRGATLLMRGPAPRKPAATEKYDLNVEVSADGTVRVIPPATNAPATNPPAQ
jgi:septal ring factor EnvC (AmiA/AmiB activator)